MQNPNYSNLVDELVDEVGKIEPNYERVDAIAMLLKSRLEIYNDERN